MNPVNRNDAIKNNVPFGLCSIHQCHIWTKYTSGHFEQQPNYDASLASKLGADDYGMKSYFLVILKTGSNTTTDKALISKSFSGHLENIDKMVADGKLIVAGPMGTNDQDYRGIFILDNLGSMEEAKELLQTDPAIVNNLLGYDIFTWYSSAALAEYLPLSDKIWKLKP